jgi:ABC-type multidrug transport system fused ATPase/permease subunit
MPSDLSLRATLRELVPYLRPNGAGVAAGCALLVASAAIGLLQPLAAQKVLETLARGDSLLWPLLVLSGLVVLAAIALGLGSYLLLRSAESIVLAGRRGLVRRLLGLTMAAMRRQAPGDLLARVTADTTLLRQIAIQAVSQALLGGVMLVGALILMAIVDLVLFATVIGVVLLLGFTVGVVMPRIRHAAKDAQASVGEMGAELERVLGAFTTVKASGAEHQELVRVGEAAARARDQGTRLARWSAVAGTSAGLCMQVAFLVVLGVGGARVDSGAISVATLVAFLLYVLYVAQPVMQLVNASTYFQAGRAALGRIAELQALDIEDVDVELPLPPQARPATPPPPAALRFEDVGFTYPGRSQPALSDLDLEVPAGRLTAVVGPSGAGKSTLLSLVERFHEPDRGRILLDDHDLRAWPLRELRGLIAYVEQDAPVMAGTLRANLAYATPGATDAELLEVLEACRLEPLLERLGGDLGAEILHRGSSVSGGERQRIAIARALLRRPRLLLLDEATSQLDAANEAALRDVIAELADRTTVLVVAHRLSTVRAADRIAVLQDGRLRAVGNHDALVVADELYASFVATQLGAGLAAA